MGKYGIILIFLLIASIGWQIFNSRKYKPAWVNTLGGLFWMMLGTGGAIIMIIKLFTN